MMVVVGCRKRIKIKINDGILDVLAELGGFSQNFKQKKNNFWWITANVAADENDQTNEKKNFSAKKIAHKTNIQTHKQKQNWKNFQIKSNQSIRKIF